MSIKLPTPPAEPAREKTCWQCGRTFETSRDVCPDDGAKLLDLVLDNRDLLIGQTLDGRYLVRRCLAEGGMGKVYAAYEKEVDREVAIKVLKADYLRDETIRKRFMHEARIVANLSHPNVVDLYDFGQRPNGNFYMVMELLHGESLADRLANKFLSYKEILSIVPGVCDALAQAHALGVVHRDLKPENIFIVKGEDGEERAKLIDFGVARQVERQTLTQTGSLWGTPAYMSPEQCRGDQVTESGDIYAMGVILYELVCGHLPFSASTQMGYAVKHMHSEPRPMKSAPGLQSPPDALDALVIKTLGKTAEARPQSMREFADELNAIIDAEFATEESLTPVPALEVDPVALNVWMAEGDDIEARSSEVPQDHQDRLRDSSPGSFETEAVFSPGPPPARTNPASRMMLAATAIVSVLLVVVVILAINRSQETSKSESDRSTGQEFASRQTSPLPLKTAAPVADEVMDGVLARASVDGGLIEESPEQSASSNAVGQGAMIAAHVAIISERMTMPTSVVQEIATQKKSISGRRNKSSSRGKTRGKKKLTNPKPATKSEVKNALRKTF